jgi:predicted PurR-regulated permease PerM
VPGPNWAFAILIVVLHMVFQQFDLNYLIPRIIGRRVHLPPIVVILGIVTGAVLAGILGIPLAAPTIASARVIGRYIYSNLFDLEPFPVEEEQPLLSVNPKWWQHPAKDRIK